MRLKILDSHQVEARVSLLQFALMQPASVVFRNNRGIQKVSDDGMTGEGFGRVQARKVNK